MSKSKSQEMKPKDKWHKAGWEDCERQMREIIDIKQREFKGIKEANISFSIYKNALMVDIDKKKYLSMGTVFFEDEGGMR